MIIEKSGSHSVVSDSVTPWIIARLAPLPMGFSRQDYCSGLPLPSPGCLPDPGIEPRSPALPADSLPFKPPGKPLMITSPSTQALCIEVKCRNLLIS